MGICNKVAGILAPIALGFFVMHGLGDLKAQVQAADPATRNALLDAFAARVHAPYLGMALVLGLLGAWILRSPLPEVRASDAGTPRDAGGVQRGIFAFPHLWLGVLCLFVYVGVEVMAGDAIGTYGRGFGLPPDETKMFTSITLFAMLLGYVAGLLAIPRFIQQSRYLAGSAVLGVVFSLCAYATHGYASVGFVAALGFANAMMWPAIFPLAINRLGRLTEVGSALLIMGIAGGALIPQAFAILRQHHDFQLAFLALMLPCYLYILFYALRGHRIGLGATPA
jgi:glucose/galactose transporter